jgi:hypothetical protein
MSDLQFMRQAIGAFAAKRGWTDYMVRKAMISTRRP